MLCTNILSFECNKVLTDILGKTEFLSIVKIQIKTHDPRFSSSLISELKYLFNERNNTSKLKKIRTRSNLPLETESPAKD